MERTTVGSILRATQAYCLQVCEKETLEHGIAYYSMRFPNLPEANQFREVMLDGGSMRDAFDEAEAWFARRGLRCHRWAPAQEADTPSMAAFLKDKGFRQIRMTALHLATWPEVSRVERSLRILPARAMRTAFRITFAGAAGDSESPLRRELADACLERLDDPQLDMFVCMVGDKPAGRCGLYQVGDIARVLDLSVISGFEGIGVEETLILHVLGMARRLAFRNVCAQVEHGSGNEFSLMTGFGFVADGEIVEYHRPGEILPRE